MIYLLEEEKPKAFLSIAPRIEFILNKCFLQSQEDLRRIIFHLNFRGAEKFSWMVKFISKLVFRKIQSSLRFFPFSYE